MERGGGGGAWMGDMPSIPVRGECSVEENDKLFQKSVPNFYKNQLTSIKLISQNIF